MNLSYIWLEVPPPSILGGVVLCQWGKQQILWRHLFLFRVFFFTLERRGICFGPPILWSWGVDWWEVGHQRFCGEDGATVKLPYSVIRSMRELNVWDELHIGGPFNNCIIFEIPSKLQSIGYVPTVPRISNECKIKVNNCKTIMKTLFEGRITYP